MNKTIQNLVEKLEATRDSYNRTRATIQAELQEALNKQFDKDKDLEQAVRELESSVEYSGDEAGEVFRFVRFSVPSKYSKFTDELNNWFSESHGVYLDTGSSPSQWTILKSYCGECIIVNEDGDVFLDHKLIIDVDKYTNEDGEQDTAKRNQLIEEYMEKSGFFPDVLSQDRYGNLYTINTKSNE